MARAIQKRDFGSYAATPMTLTVQTFVLRKAAKLLGGPGALHDYLRVPSRDLTRWISGEEQPPMGVFLQVIDLLESRAADAAAPMRALAARRRHASVLHER